MSVDKKDYMKEYNQRPEVKEQKREYHRKYRKTKHVEYVGVCLCPKCGKKGYKRYQSSYNAKTGRYHSLHTAVLHQHHEKGKTVYDGGCYIGMGKL